ncbi:hypothetical protein Clacol_000298 [Clathrus columnatus]|uniref:Haloacid dehalogenase-like hydrolase domain-containing protein 3 n=1 Tax=Clathrus columnatus TaxID=1419009 RepID=A0AAV4ZYR1_9AGAM|nr:hypothetical protein Clacol_000298 [Clathrus columnatus]
MSKTHLEKKYKELIDKFQDETNVNKHRIRLSSSEENHDTRLDTRALKDLQHEKPVYTGGAEDWWKDVIRRTALSAGGDPEKLENSLPLIVPRLMHRFSSSEGYKAFDDVIPTLSLLKNKGFKTGVVTNSDSRIKSVIADLGLSTYLDIVVVSEEEGIEKPDKEIWQRTCSRLNIHTSKACHTGDELVCDYYGAQKAGLHPFLLRRPGSEGEGERKEVDEGLNDINVIQTLGEIVEKI